MSRGLQDIEELVSSCLEARCHDGVLVAFFFCKVLLRTGSTLGDSCLPCGAQDGELQEERNTNLLMSMEV